MSFCCTSCFERAELRQFITSNGKRSNSPCQYCGAHRTYRLDPEQLRDAFLRVIEAEFIPFQHATQAGALEACEEGDYLADLLDQEFGVFNDALTGPDDARSQLLQAILVGDRRLDKDFDEPYGDDTEFWIRRDDDWANRSLKESWSYLRDDVAILGHSLLIGNKYIGDMEGKIGYDEIRRLLHLAVQTLPSNAAVFRARRGKGHTGAALAAPPPHLAGAGRANIKGQPVLYAGSDVETAVYEVRPSVGDIVSVGEFRLRREARICDLTPSNDHYSRLRPFGSEQDFKDYKRLISEAQVRNTLGASLATPVRRDDEDIDYLPTQVISRIAAHEGFDGIRFASSQRGAKGASNYVLFDPLVGQQEGRAWHVQIRKIDYQIERSPEADDDREP